MSDLPILSSNAAIPTPADRRPQPPHVTVCICTFRRPHLLQQLLDGVSAQRTEGAFTFSIVVADNDATESGEAVVASFCQRFGIPVTYCVEPVRNIALTRNRALSHATGDYIAFIDDDECPVPDWLRLMLATCERTGAAGVLGPVRPRFEAPPPAWVLRGRFCERPEHPTGTVMPWEKSRTGNLLFRRSILTGLSEPFRSEFGTGGEDVDFFHRLAAAQHIVVWCNEAAAYEAVPLNRCTRAYMLKRALLRGANNSKLRRDAVYGLCKAFVAIPLYAAAMPITVLLGQAVFMHVTIRCCDHLGRLLAAFGLRPVGDRPV